MNSSADNLIKIGTRNSALAMAQSGIVRDELTRIFPEYKFELYPIITTGDARRDNLNLKVEDKKQWVIEIEQKLLNQEIDLAIHSAKDVPLNLEAGTEICTILKRESFNDIIISKDLSIRSIEDLPQNANVGTSSKRRHAQLKNVRRDIIIVPLKGNIDSRIRKLLDNNIYDAIVLAEAGVNRLNIKGLNSNKILNDNFLPAVGQGQLLSQFLASRFDIKAMLDKIRDINSDICYHAERAVVDRIGADCHSAFSILATIKEDKILIKSSVFDSDGGACISHEVIGPVSEAQDLAKDLSSKLISLGARKLLSKN